MFSTRPFARFASREGIKGATLREAVLRAERGLIDADLGGGVLKQRVARQGRGRSGGYRTILLFRREDRAIFVHGFAKSAQANIGTDELAAFRRLASVMLALDDAGLARAVESGALVEIGDEQSLSE